MPANFRCTFYCFIVLLFGYVMHLRSWCSRRTTNIYFDDDDDDDGPASVLARLTYCGRKVAGEHCTFANSVSDSVLRLIFALCFSSSVIFLLVDACVGLNWLLVSFLSHVNKKHHSFIHY